MNQQRTLLWTAALLAVLGIRWWDPLGRQAAAVQPASAAVVRATGTAAMIGPRSGRGGAPDQPPGWPLRTTAASKDDGNAFPSRAEVAQLAAKRQQILAPPPPAPPPYVAPPPPPPVEPPPPLEVIGTWGSDPDLAVFLAGPQGTVIARRGETLMAQYKVQSISKQQITLLQTSNQRVWNIAIPPAPSTLQTWPGR